MFCTQCGAKLNDGAKFCGECGADTSGMMPAQAGEATQAIPAAETQAMPLAATKAMPGSATQAVPTGATQAMPAAASQASPGGGPAQQESYSMGATQVMPTTYVPQADVANAGYQPVPHAQYQAPGAGYPYGVQGASGGPGVPGGPGAPGGPDGRPPQGKGNGKIIAIVVGILALVVIVAIVVAVALMCANSSKSSSAASSSASSASSQVESSSGSASSSASNTASSSASSSAASPSASSASSSSASSASPSTDPAAEARKKAESQGKLVLEGTLHVTTNAERAKQVDPNLKGFEKDNTQLIWLEVNPPVQVNGIYPGDTTATPKAVKAFNLGAGDMAALAKLDGKHVMVAIDPDAAKAKRYWPTDISGILFDVGGPFELIYAK